MSVPRRDYETEEVANTDIRESTEVQHFFGESLHMHAYAQLQLAKLALCMPNPPTLLKTIFGGLLFSAFGTS